jgi:hypothetical protein
VYYEWDIETTNEEGEIYDHNFADTLSEVVLTEGDLVLIRSVGNENTGLVDRSWAYVKDGKLPACFYDGCENNTAVPVPKRFVSELEKKLKQNKCFNLK